MILTEISNLFAGFSVFVKRGRSKGRNDATKRQGIRRAGKGTQIGTLRNVLDFWAFGRSAKAFRISTARARICPGVICKLRSEHGSLPGYEDSGCRMPKAVPCCYRRCMFQEILRQHLSPHLCLQPASRLITSELRT